MFKYFWLHSKSFASLKGKISLLAVVKKIECVQKILTTVKKIEQGKKNLSMVKFFELADGMGSGLPKLLNTYTT